MPEARQGGRPVEQETAWEKQWMPQHLSSLGNEPWDAVWDRLMDGFCRETVPAGTVFYQQGDPADEVLYLQSGQVRVEASPALALKLFQVSARKSQVLSRVLVQDSFLSVQGRVIQFLLSLAERNGVQEEAGIRLTIRLTHQEAADFLGISRVAVSQCFQTLAKAGLLRKREHCYILPDRAALEAQLE